MDVASAAAAAGSAVIVDDRKVIKCPRNKETIESRS
jgi:hypothetical protein